MSRLSGEWVPRNISRHSSNRGAVEPTAALVAVLAIGAALGLYTVAVANATPEYDRPTATATLDRIEPTITTGGVVEPERLDAIQFRTPTAVELLADGDRWGASSGDHAPEQTTLDHAGVAVAERTVTVRVAPGQNVRGTLRVVVRQ